MTLAGDRLLIMRETGELVLAAATPDAYRPIAHAQILPPTVRSYPALSDGFLYARNNDTHTRCAGVPRPSPVEVRRAGIDHLSRPRSEGHSGADPERARRAALADEAGRREARVGERVGT